MRVVKTPKFVKTLKFLAGVQLFDPRAILERHGRMGVNALADATPADTGDTASKWDYKITGNRKRYELIWTNSEIAGSVPLVVLLQYGHATKSGYFIQGIDFINPAIKPVIQSLKTALLQEVI